ncbi:Predicted arabinose efflux permease, MFS family [Friedmanniella luteola]|uniref:Predicted arabinose efflux permease, MFS family n=1 Tax=Friedmanniella luteola TaxID=546871 RepID=A0A1H1RNM9_9ACTN|nr:MFS transporter [Friedmanniella luteola]SDS37304.1 Predicted arabinose efflux permease, MFS family [Friedmanniella luteola]
MRAGGRRRAGAGVVALCLVQFVDVLGVTSATTALPAMTADLAAPAWSTGVLATVYAMFFGAFLILGARLGDRYGHRRVLLIGVALFAVVALAGLSAQEIVQLVVARALQGLAAALSVPSALRLLLHLTPQPAGRRTAVAAWGATGAAAGALGFLAGGFLTDLWSWRALYWVNVPIGLALLVVIAATVPALPPDEDRRRLDLAGASLLVVAIMAVVVGTSMVERADLRLGGAGAVAVGVGVTAAFLAQQRRAAEPLIPRTALTSPNLRTGTVLSFVNTATTSSAGVMVALDLQQRQGASPLQAGLALLPFSVAVVVGSALAGPLARRLGGRRLARLGLVAVAGGTALLAATRGSPTGILGGVVVAGVGLGIAAVAATSIGTDVQEGLAGSAAGILNTGAQLGTAIGVAALVTLAGTLSPRGLGTPVAWAAAAALATAAAVALTWPPRPRLAAGPQDAGTPRADTPGAADPPAAGSATRAGSRDRPAARRRRSRGPRASGSARRARPPGRSAGR